MEISRVKKPEIIDLGFPRGFQICTIYDENSFPLEIAKREVKKLFVQIMNLWFEFLLRRWRDDGSRGKITRPQTRNEPFRADGWRRWKEEATGPKPRQKHSFQCT